MSIQDPRASRSWVMETFSPLLCCQGDPAAPIHLPLFSRPLQSFKLQCKREVVSANGHQILSYLGTMVTPDQPVNGPASGQQSLSAPQEPWCCSPEAVDKFFLAPGGNWGRIDTCLENHRYCLQHIFDGKCKYPAYPNLHAFKDQFNSCNHFILKIMTFCIHVVPLFPWHKSVAFSLRLVSVASPIQFVAPYFVTRAYKIELWRLLWSIVTRTVAQCQIAPGTKMGVESFSRWAPVAQIPTS